MNRINSSRNSGSSALSADLSSPANNVNQHSDTTVEARRQSNSGGGAQKAHEHVREEMGANSKQLIKSVRFGDSPSNSSKIAKTDQRISRSDNPSSMKVRPTVRDGESGTAVRGSGTTILAASMWRSSMREKGYRDDPPKTASQDATSTTTTTATVARTAATAGTTVATSIDTPGYPGIFDSSAQRQTGARSQAQENVQFDSEESGSSELSSTESGTFSVPLSKPALGQERGPVLSNTITSTAPLTTTTATNHSLTTASGSAATHTAFENDNASGRAVESTDRPGGRRRALTRQHAVKNKEGGMQFRVSQQARPDGPESGTASERSASSKVSAKPAMRSATPVNAKLSEHESTLRDIAERGNAYLKSGNKTAAKDMVSLERYLAADPPPSIITICASKIANSPPADYFAGLSRSNAKVAFISDMLPIDPTDDDIKALCDFNQLPQAVWDNRAKIKIVGTNADQLQINLLKMKQLQDRLSQADKENRSKMIAQARQFLKAWKATAAKKTVESLKDDLKRAHNKLKSAGRQFGNTSLDQANREFGTVAMKLIRGGKERAADETYKNLVESSVPAILDFCRRHPDYTAIYVGNVRNLFDSVKDGTSRSGLNSILFEGLISHNGGGAIVPIIFGGKQFEVTKITQKEAFEGTEIDEDGNEIRVDFGVTSVHTSRVYLHIPASLYE